MINFIIGYQVILPSQLRAFLSRFLHVFQIFLFWHQWSLPRQSLSDIFSLFCAFLGFSSILSLFSPFQLLRVVFLSVTCKSHIEPTGGNFSVVVFSPHKAVYFTTQLFVVSVRDNFTQFPLREIPSPCPLKCKCKPGFSEWKSETENRKTEFTIGFT